MTPLLAGLTFTASGSVNAAATAAQWAVGVSLVTLIWTGIAFFLGRAQVAKLSRADHATSLSISGRSNWMLHFQAAKTEVDGRNRRVQLRGIATLRVLAESPEATVEDLRIVAEVLRLIGQEG